jgi:hypothetical protein
MARPVSQVYVHHSAGSAGKDHAATVRSIQAQHMDVQGWSDIAYHELVAPDGDVYEGRGLDWQGGATQGQNSTSVAWCLLGNFEVEDVTPAAVDALCVRIAQAARDGRLSPGFRIDGHRDANATACPGSRLYALLPSIRQRVALLLAPKPTPEPEDPEMYVRYNLDPATATAASQPAVWLVCALGRFAPPADLLGAIEQSGAVRHTVTCSQAATRQFLDGHPG